ncbi:MAG: protein-tyrosine-phosphatase [Saprospiraceae bacterium]|nr:protein-tyrosine-phosphatase [Saprospiraceae bacterium]
MKKIEKLLRETDLISAERKKELQQLAFQIERQLKEIGKAQVLFICTHNSRRSQLAELWLRLAARYHNLAGITSFSGGTESTTFNSRMVDAIIRFGIKLEGSETKENPSYMAFFTKNEPDNVEMFSKRYDDTFNPQSDFIAVMVCDQADTECPVVSGADIRLSLPYKDPKEADNRPNEQLVYDEKVKEIGREVLYMTGLLSDTL